MTGIDDNVKLDLQCPHCKRKFAKSIRELKGTGVKCPHCGLKFETSQFKKGIGEVDRALKDFSRNFKINIKL